jgi:hypothetical protein
MLKAMRRKNEGVLAIGNVPKVRRFPNEIKAVLLAGMISERASLGAPTFPDCFI